MNLRPEEHIFEGRSAVIVALNHSIVNDVDDSALGLKRIGLIVKLFTPFLKKANLAAEAIYKDSIILAQFQPNTFPIQFEAWVGLVDIRIDYGLRVRLGHLVLESETSILHVIIEPVVRFLPGLSDAHDAGKKDARWYIQARSLGLHGIGVCM